jgi:hypothetical protein
MRTYIAQIDAVTISLFTAILALSVSFIGTILNATVLESRRQNRIREAEKAALQEALYSEIGWTVRALSFWIPVPSGSVPVGMTWKKLAEKLGKSASFEVYRYTRTHPAIFYQLADAYNIESFYRSITNTLDEISLKGEGLKENDQREQIDHFLRHELREMLLIAFKSLDLDKLEDLAINRMGPVFGGGTEPDQTELEQYQRAARLMEKLSRKPWEPET